MFEILFLIIVSAYFIQSFLLYIGTKKKFSKINEDILPSATVIVAARNEENNISTCLKSLDGLIYPKGKLEIIIVDDSSTDNTNKIIKDFIFDKPRFRLIKPTKDYGSTKGKARAIANAIEISNGEIILTTDADCIVPNTWVKSLASYYEDDVAMVCGFTNQKWKNLFEGIQDTDFMYLLTVAAGAINLGKPLSAIGNNMSYRKSVYNEIGGYTKIPFSVTEDFQMLMAINKLKKYKIIYPLEPEAVVTSAPCEDLKTLFRQKKRWAVGGLNSKLDSLIIISTGFWVAIFTLLIPFFYSATLIYLLLFKIFTDMFMIYFAYKNLKLRFSIGNFIGFEFYSIIYFVIISFTLIFNRNVYWKGRKF